MIANTTINAAEIACTSCMSETITVKDKYSNPIQIQIHYDSGCQHSLASRLKDIQQPHSTINCLWRIKRDKATVTD